MKLRKQIKRKNQDSKFIGNLRAVNLREVSIHSIFAKKILNKSEFAIKIVNSF